MFVCSLCLVLALAACGSPTSTSGSTPTPAATSQPSSSPTAASSPTTSTSSTTLTTYTGSGYTIGYPQGWKVNASGKNVVFADPTGIYSFTIVITPDPGGAISPDTVLNTTVQVLTNTLKNTQTMNVPASTTIGGDTWMQKSIAGTSSAAGQTGTVQVVIAVDNHPANSASTNTYTITYQTLQATFDAANGQYFQPMLQSFKFTS
ncbi:MAG TPA: hypothetical protein VIZ18_14760 [Ktedonobacteraceae bacterium]